MQNRYGRDLGDFGKLGRLREFCPSGETGDTPRLWE